MNPMNSYPTVGKTTNEHETITTAEKVGKHLAEINQQNSQHHLEQCVYKMERDGSESIRLLCQEIDQLKIEISMLKSNTVSKK